MNPVVILVIFASLVTVFWCLMLVRLVKSEDEAIHKALDEYTCTRPAPHICKLNGPCNGFPKDWKNR